MTSDDKSRLVNLRARLKVVSSANRGAGRNAYREFSNEAQSIKTEIARIEGKYLPAKANEKPKMVDDTLDQCLERTRERFGPRPKQPRVVLSAGKYQQLKKYILERDGWCLFCGRPDMLTPAHFKRRSQGGNDAPNNLFCACVDCHKKFDDGGNNPPPEIAEKLPVIIGMLEGEPDKLEK